MGFLRNKWIEQAVGSVLVAYVAPDFHEIDGAVVEWDGEDEILIHAAAEALYARYADTAYRDDSERVFCHDETGGSFDRHRYADTFRAALAKAKVDGYVRPFHEGRHTAITNAAAAGVPPAALQAMAGHGDLSTTQRYIDLAGVLFRSEAEAAEARMFGAAQAAEPDVG